LKGYEVVSLKRPGLQGKTALFFHHVPLSINLPVVYFHKKLLIQENDRQEKFTNAIP
jgi:hypothetical protein